MHNSFSGVITAIVTPFRNNKIDFKAFERLLIKQMEAKVNGIVVAGSTGEALSLTTEEYTDLINFTTNIVNDEIPIIAGCTAINTAHALQLARISQSAKVRGLMCTVPLYSRPNQQGLISHFTAIHENTNLPIILYTVPKRTGQDFTDDTILQLASLPRIIALKDASNDLERPLRLSARLNNKFSLLSGDDGTALAFYAQGGVGCISVAANIAPKILNKIQLHWQNGQYKEAFNLQQKLLPLYQALFIETNPVPIKYALSLLGLCRSETRLPLCLPITQNSKVIKNVIKDLLNFLE